jgi:hypothetical protein
MRHDPGLAASPPVRYILGVERSGYSSFHLPRPLWTDDLTVGEWLDAWLSDLKPLMGAGEMTYSTYKRYADIIRKHLKPALGHRKLKDLNRAEVRKLYASKGDTLSPRTVDYIHTHLAHEALDIPGMSPVSEQHLALMGLRVIGRTPCRALLPYVGSLETHSCAWLPS